MDWRRQPEAPIEWVIEIAAGVVAVVVAAISMFTYSGPYRWVNEFQMSQFGSASGLVSLAVVTITLLLALRIIVVPARALVVRGTDAAESTRHDPAEKELRIASTLIAMMTPIMLSIGGAGLLIFGYWGIRSFGSAKTQESVQIEDLCSGVAPASPWVAISGVPLNDYSVGIEQYTTHWYIPIAETPSATGAVCVVAKVHSRKMSTGIGISERQEIEGVLKSLPVPGPVRAGFEDGGITLSPDYRVLEFHSTPEMETTGSRRCMKIGAVVLPIGMVWLLVTLFRTGLQRNR